MPETEVEMPAARRRSRPQATRQRRGSAERRGPFRDNRRSATLPPECPASFRVLGRPTTAVGTKSCTRAIARLWARFAVRTRMSGVEGGALPTSGRRSAADDRAVLAAYALRAAGRCPCAKPTPRSTSICSVRSPSRFASSGVATTASSLLNTPTGSPNGSPMPRCHGRTTPGTSSPRTLQPDFSARSSSTQTAPSTHLDVDRQPPSCARTAGSRPFPTGHRFSRRLELTGKRFWCLLLVT